MNRREKILALGLVAVVLVGLGVRLWMRLDPGFAVDLREGTAASGAARSEAPAGDPDLRAHLDAIQTGPAAPGEPTVRPGPRARVDLNTAGEAELMLLDGIGPERARAIVEYRRRHGPFRTLGDLDRVRGIGPRTLERLAPWVTTGDGANDRAE